MKEGLRQSMAWLHTWLGLIVGWVLFFVYLTGTLGYFDTEIDHWMTPDKPFFAAVPSGEEQLLMAQSRLENVAEDASSWNIQLIGGREASTLDISWTPEAGGVMREALNPVTGQPMDNSARATGGGQLLYKMHYNLAYLPLNWANIFIEICSVIMFIAMISGIIVHKKIFKDMFTFRPGKGQRSWLDGHNVLSVTSIPFHLMVTYSGLLFFIYIFMPAAPEYVYQDESNNTPVALLLYKDVYGTGGVVPEVEPPSLELAPLAAIAPLLEQAENIWGVDKITAVTVEYPGHANAKIIFRPLPSESVAAPQYSLVFDGPGGELIEEDSGPYIHAAGKADQILKGLHKGLFSGPFLRVLYVFMGLAGTAMIGTGLLLWSNKRKTALLAKQKDAHIGIEIVDRLNLSTIIGLPIAIAAYFWANRLIPAELQGRQDWEVHAMYFTLALMFIYPIWRPLEKARLDMLWLAAASYILLPLVNLLTTQRHLGISMFEGDWVMAGFDLTALVCGLVFALYAKKARVSKSTAVQQDALTSSAALQEI